MIPLLSFLAPGRLWLLVLIPLLVLLYLGMVQRKRNRSAQVSQTMFDLVIPRDRTWLRHVAVGLSILSLLTLTLAFAKPKDQVSVPRERATVIEWLNVQGLIITDIHNFFVLKLAATADQAGGGTLMSEFGFCFGFEFW